LEAREAGRDIVDGAPKGAELVRELARQADLRRLRRGVGLDAGEADAEPGAARDVDDPAGARRLHARHTACARLKTPVTLTSKICCHCWGVTFSIAGRLAADAAGVGDEDVDAAAAGEHLGDESLDRIGIGDVDRAHLDPAPAAGLCSSGDAQPSALTSRSRQRRRAPRNYGRCAPKPVRRR